LPPGVKPPGEKGIGSQTRAEKFLKQGRKQKNGGDDAEGHLESGRKSWLVSWPSKSRAAAARLLAGETGRSRRNPAKATESMTAARTLGGEAPVTSA
jgi:hypothetical protein